MKTADGVEHAMELEFPKGNVVERMIQSCEKELIADQDCSCEIGDGDICECFLQVVLGLDGKVVESKQ
jgi:hypothetical protein